MATKRDPFDLSDTSDLPKDIQKAVNGRQVRGSSTEKRILDLIGRAGKALNSAELRAVFYRVHAVELTRTQASNAMHHLCQQGRLSRVGVGRYVVSAATDKATA